MMTSVWLGWSVCTQVSTTAARRLDVDNNQSFSAVLFPTNGCSDTLCYYGITSQPQHYHITYGDYTNGQQAFFIIVYRRKMVVCWRCFRGVVGGRVAMLM